VTAAHSEFAALTNPGVNTFPSRIPVAGGEHLGLRTDSPSSAEDVDCLRDSVAADVSGNSDTGDPDPAIGASPTFFYTNPGTLLNVSATVEPDADRDGHGDETQDQCPTSAATQGDCDPPQTKITKDPPNKTDESTVKFRFRSDEASSSFECKVDKKRWKPCGSPKRVKRLDEGKHRFKVRAIDTAGNPDPTPDKDKFKVVD
jgi:hypothetical protein